MNGLVEKAIANNRRKRSSRLQDDIIDTAAARIHPRGDPAIQ